MASRVADYPIHVYKRPHTGYDNEYLLGYIVASDSFLASNEKGKRIMHFQAALIVDPYHSRSWNWVLRMMDIFRDKGFCDGYRPYIDGSVDSTWMLNELGKPIYTEKEHCEFEERIRKISPNGDISQFMNLRKEWVYTPMVVIDPEGFIHKHEDIEDRCKFAEILKGVFHRYPGHKVVLFDCHI